MSNIDAKGKFIETLTTLLLKLGYNPALIGFDYTVEATRFAFTHTSYRWRYVKDLYPIIGKQFNTNASNVERCIRTSIDVFWIYNNLDHISKTLAFGAKYYVLEKPTNSEMISILVKYMSKHFVYINDRFIQINDYIDR